MNLKPCPFCGSQNIDVFETDSGIGGMHGKYNVMCCNCYYVATCDVKTKREAARLWNKRKIGVPRMFQSQANLRVVPDALH